AFKSVDTPAIVLDHGEGSKIYDTDGNEYIDYVLSWGPLILEHRYPQVISHLHEAIDKGTSFGASTLLQNKLARLVMDRVTSIEKVRLVSSGTEAT
ncbi:aminotransferase class III-fold pyridoxal phosphate-dependent enzyme, partial [Staphylococcus aureus]|uniref:aminotransferase class III-fold pyridoxal phosphate-dependent enzyme n=1 Tax=Staphylococcus aureus TaxID=1280 RepID=UPI0010231536